MPCDRKANTVITIPMSWILYLLILYVISLKNTVIYIKYSAFLKPYGTTTLLLRYEVMLFMTIYDFKYNKK